MNPQEPVVISSAFGHELAARGARFACDLFREGLSQKHPLRSLLSEASKQLNEPPLQSGYSRELIRVARYGLQLAAVQSWDGFDELLQRVKGDTSGWEAHLHEAYVGFQFALAGCDGSFFEGQSMPDVRIARGAMSAVVECKRSDRLTAAERRNREIWQLTTGEILRYICGELPAAMIRFYPQRDAAPEDQPLLLGHTKDLVREYKDHYAPKAWWKRTHSSDAAFRCTFVASQSADEVFNGASESHPGIEVPSDLEPFSLRLQLTLTDPPMCDAIWWVKVHNRRNWSRVERAILNRVDKKASQMNRFRRSGHDAAGLPGIIWIEHPALREADDGELRGLRHRVVGKLQTNAGGHFGAVAGVVLTDSRLLIDKTGQLHEQHRFNFAANPNYSSQGGQHLPFISWEWWEAAQSSRLPRVKVLGLDMSYGSATSTLGSD